jgi:hypothetical protein
LLRNKIVVLKSADGSVVSGASVTWESGPFRSTSPRVTDSSGRTTWSSIPAGPVRFTISPSSRSQSGVYRLTGSWTGEASMFGAGNSEVFLPAPTAPALYRVGVRTFADLRITNATVQVNNATCTLGIWTSIACDNTRVGGVLRATLSDSAGNASVPAYCGLIGTPCSVTVSFIDGDLAASISRSYLACGPGETTCLDGAENWLIRFADVPYVVLNDVAVGQPFNQPLTLTARALAGVDTPIEGKTITLSTTTSGAIGRGCPAVLSAVTNSAGYATFSLCPTRVAFWVADAPGLVASAPLLVAVQLAPEAPTALMATSRAVRSVILSWSAPRIVGASSVTDYVVQYRQVGSETWLTFADGRSTRTTVTVSRLVSSIVYEFRVAALNSSGSSVYTAPVTRAAN